MELTIALLPCPFCGQGATVEFTGRDRDFLTIGCPDIHCRGCHPMNAAPFERLTTEVLAWNTRVPSAISRKSKKPQPAGLGE